MNKVITEPAGVKCRHCGEELQRVVVLVHKAWLLTPTEAAYLENPYNHAPEPADERS